MGSIVRGYYAEKDNSLDVLFMGNSDMYRAVLPIELWDNYGIASYAYTSSGQRMWTGYYVLLDALRSQHPDIIVFNIDGVNSDNQSSESNYRKAFDNMEWSKVKFKAIMLDDGFNFNLMKRTAFVFPILRFHDRYKELTKEDFELAYKNEVFSYKGYDLIADINGYEGGFSYMDNNNETFNIHEKVKKYLDKIVETCKNENIKLILVEVPSADSWSLAKSQTISKYAKDNGLEFIDFNLLLDDINFDWKMDTPDKGDHLNIFGAEKVTKYIGEYLSSNYDLPDRRNDKNYSSWYKDSEIFHRDVENAKNELQNN
jgi:hypothetical protein